MVTPILQPYLFSLAHVLPSLFYLVCMLVHLHHIASFLKMRCISCISEISYPLNKYTLNKWMSGLMNESMVWSFSPKTAQHDGAYSSHKINLNIKISSGIVREREFNEQYYSNTWHLLGSVLSTHTRYLLSSSQWAYHMDPVSLSYRWKTEDQRVAIIGINISWLKVLA